MWPIEGGERTQEEREGARGRRARRGPRRCSPRSRLSRRRQRWVSGAPPLQHRGPHMPHGAGGREHRLAALTPGRSPADHTAAIAALALPRGWARHTDHVPGGLGRVPEPLPAETREDEPSVLCCRSLRRTTGPAAIGRVRPRPHLAVTSPAPRGHPTPARTPPRGPERQPDGGSRGAGAEGIGLPGPREKDEDTEPRVCLKDAHRLHRAPHSDLPAGAAGQTRGRGPGPGSHCGGHPRRLALT